jgi:SAM-dependent methyltransferase
LKQDKTIYGLDIQTQWERILEIHVLKLAKEHHPDWYRWRLTNNYERAVFLKGDPVFPRETTRYLWANQNLYGEDILEVGCSTGYGSQFLPHSAIYLGLDYDPVIIDVAKEQDWGDTREFEQADVNTYEMGHHDTIIAFEVIEHLDNGLEIVKKLQTHCDRLLITVPWNEPKGFWGEHHKLHGLNESNFPDFQFAYISEAGNITDKPQDIGETNRCNLMLCRWDR